MSDENAKAKTQVIDGIHWLFKSTTRYMELNASLEARLAIAVSALRWYAEEAMKQVHEYGDGLNALPSYKIYADHGDKARSALAKITAPADAEGGC
jgi:hypothetical protein